MSNFYLGYHKTHTYGSFSGDVFYTNTNIPKGRMFYVISGNKFKNDPVEYFLEGKYSVIKSEDNSNSKYQKQKNHLSLKCIARVSEPILLNDFKEFDKDSFHKHFTSGQASKEIKGTQAYLIKLFDGMLDVIDEPYELSIINDFDHINNDENEDDDTERMELKKPELDRVSSERILLNFGVEARNVQ